MTTFTLTFPVHRNYVLSANQRLHWAKFRERSNCLNDLGFTMARLARQPRMETARVTCAVAYPNTRHRRDAHNYFLTVKHLIDGAVRAGVLPDDNDKHVTGIEITRHPTCTGMKDWFRFYLTFDGE